jgi:hypothetical protein
MKTLLPLLLFVAGSAFGQVETLDFGPRGKLTLYLLGDWKTNATNMAGQYTLSFTPKNDSVNASGNIVVSFPDVDRFDTKQRLKLRVETDAYALAQSSGEKRAVAKEFTLTTGYGFYCSFTDPELRGKPSQPGNYKVMTVGKIRINPEVLVEVQMMADGFGDEAYQQLLGAIEGMEYTPGRAR